MPAGQATAAPGLTWCGHRGRYRVTAILCGPRGWSDRLMACETCGREYLASELAQLRAGHTHRQPAGARPPAGLAAIVPAHDGAGQTERTGSMTAPGTDTQRPKGEPAPATRERPAEDLGEGFIQGNLTEDPELRFTPSGRAVAKVRVAYTPRIKDPDSGRWSDGETEFYTVNVWGQQAENTAEALQRGDRIVASGRWSKRFWEDREGEVRESIELTAADLGPSLLFRQAVVVRTKRQGGGRSDA